MTYDDAFRLLQARCAATVYPLLSDVDLDDLLTGVRRFTVWTADTAYDFGSIVIPTVRNGHTYKAIVNQQFTPQPAGVSGPTEPIWPLYSNPDRHISETRPYWGGFGGPLGHYAVAQVTDNSIIWQEAGPDSVDQWDLRKATHEGWLRKAGLASADYDLSAGAGNNAFQRSQVAAQCLIMAQRYAPTGVY